MKLCIWCRANNRRPRDVLCDECAAIADDRVTDWLEKNPPAVKAPASPVRPAA